MKSCCILGAGGFLGQSLLANKPLGLDLIGLKRDDVNFFNKNTFNNIPLKSNYIIDCVNVNNGVDIDIENCNIFAFYDVIDFLKKNNFEGRYVYLSTISVLDDNMLSKSKYVYSKKKAENYLVSSGINYQIVRLSYPFGKKSNKSRLIPNLCSKISSGSDVYIKNIRININFIDDICICIYLYIDNKNEIFISNNMYFSLYEIVKRMKRHLNSSSNIYLEKSDYVFEPKSDCPYVCNYDVLEKLICESC